MTINWSEYLSGVRMWVSQCPEPVMETAVRDAAARLCNDSLIIRSTLDSITATVGNASYILTEPSDTYIVSAVSVLYNDNPLIAKTEEELDECDPGWRTAENSDGIQFYFQPIPSQITLNRAPLTEVSGGIVVKVATMPDADCEGGADLLYQEYREFICHGAIGKLKRMKDKAWEDQAGAAYHENQFNFGIQRAKARARMGNTIKSTRMKIPKV